jgi:hypothetical protein
MTDRAPVPEETKRKQHYLFKSITTDQYGHFDLRGLAPGKYNFDLRGLAPGKYNLFSLNGIDTKAIELKLIQLKSTATALA